MDTAIKTRWCLLAFMGGLLLAEEAAATGAAWIPRIGSLTTDQSTEIRLISQEITLFDLRQVSLGENQVWAFDVKAVFQFRNTSSTKKKPTFILSLCTTKEKTEPSAACQLDKTELIIKTDGKKVALSHTVKGDQVSARFSVKFGPKTGRKVELSYRIFERAAGEAGYRQGGPFAIFDYHLEDSVHWDGPIGATRLAIRLPFQADALSAHMFSKGETFHYRHSHAFYEKRKLSPGDDDGLSFYVTVPAYKNKLDILKKRVKAQPKSIKRRIALVNLLALYPGAAEELEKHLAVVLGSRLAKWDAAKQKHAVKMYSRFLVEGHRFAVDKTACDATICVEKPMIVEIIGAVCDADAECGNSHRKRLDSCCGAPSQS